MYHNTRSKISLTLTQTWELILFSAGKRKLLVYTYIDGEEKTEEITIVGTQPNYDIWLDVVQANDVSKK